MGIRSPITFPLFGLPHGVMTYEFLDENNQREFFENYSACAFLCQKCLENKKDLKEKIYHDNRLLTCYTKCPICQTKLEKSHDNACANAISN